MEFQMSTPRQWFDYLGEPTRINLDDPGQARRIAYEILFRLEHSKRVVFKVNARLTACYRDNNGKFIVEDIEHE